MRSTQWPAAPMQPIASCRSVQAATGNLEVSRTCVISLRISPVRTRSSTVGRAVWCTAQTCTGKLPTTHRASIDSKQQRRFVRRSPRLLQHHLCRARKKRGASSEDEDDHDSAAGLFSEVETEDKARPEEDEEEEEEDLGDAAVSDPTTRLFQRFSSREFDDEEEEADEEEDVAFNRPDQNDVRRRGRKRRSQYDRANEGFGIPGVDDIEVDEEVKALGDIPGVDTDLDAIMGSAFDEGSEVASSIDSEDDLETEMPSRAAQQRATEIPEGDFEEASEEEGNEEGTGPVMQYPEPPERRYRLGDLLEMCDYEVPEAGVRDIEVLGVQNIASQVKEGDLYICTLGAKHNGYLFIDLAVENGAVAVVSEQELVDKEDEELLDFPVILVDDTDEALRRLAKSFYNDASSKMLVVGITGSKGKTTASWFVRGIFEEMQNVTGMVGSIENAISVDKLTENGDLWEADEEDITLQRDCSTAFYLSPYQGKYEPQDGTPDALQIQKLMAGIADRGATACVYEADLDSLLTQQCVTGSELRKNNEQQKLLIFRTLTASTHQTQGVDIDVAVYMGLLDEDIKNYGDVDVLLDAQKKMFGALQDPLRQTAVVNMDDPHHETILEFARAVPTVTFSAVTSEADVFVEKAAFSLWETEVTIGTPAGRISLSSTLIGRHNLPNILAAVATGLALTIDGEGIPLRAIVQGIEATEIIPGRCEIIDEEQDFGVVIDAADTPERLSRLLDSIRETGPRRIILVFGCEGERDKMIRPFMGEIAHWKADIVILTNSNPRGERPSNIIADIVAGYPDDLLEHNAMQPYQPGFLQDPAYIPFEALEFSWHNNYEYRRYVMEDRWTALRWAIGTAQKKDCVVIAGKGHQDYQEWELEGKLQRGWFDDRVECRNALSKVSRLNRYGNEIDRKELPWMEPEERTDNPRVFNVEADL